MTAPASARACGARARDLAALALALGLVLAGTSVRAQQTAAVESVIAAFLLNFARFTTWPDGALRPGEPLVLCVADDRVAGALTAAVRGRNVEGRSLAVRPVRLDAPLNGCAVLFVGRGDADRLPSILQGLAGASVLTVSDADRFAERGGIVQLYIEDGRMRFAINLQNVKAAGLSLSSQLLSLARIVGR